MANSFREKLIKLIGNRSKYPDNTIYTPLYIVLTEVDLKSMDSGMHNLSSIFTSQIPVQDDTCSIVTSGGGTGICFDRKLFLLNCIGKKRIESLNDNKKKVEETLDTIEKVLGDVPIVNQLREELSDYQKSVSKVFDFQESTV